MDETLKAIAGGIAAAVNPQCDFNNCLFLLGHMRCGSTALSNVLCSRPDISGYGETHVRFGRKSSLGVLSLNQLKNRAWKPNARYIFDKILHNRYDEDAVPDFYLAKAIFLVREPRASIVSIRELFREAATGEYDNDELSTQYYIKRINTMAAHWEKFPAANRFGLSYEQLVAETNATLNALTLFLGLDTPLENHYRPNEGKVRHGAGDPLYAGSHSSIVSQPRERRADRLDVPPWLLSQAERAYNQFLSLVTPPVTKVTQS